MSEPSLIARQRALLRDLILQAAERARGEPAIAAAFQEQVDNVEIEFAETREALERRRTDELAENEQQMEQMRTNIGIRYKAEQDAALREIQQKRGQLHEREESEKEAAQTVYQEACWTIAAVLEGAKNEIEEEHRENKTRLHTRLDELHTVHKQARTLLDEWKLPVDDFEADIEDSLSAEKTEQPPKLSECVVEAKDLLEQLRQLRLPRYLTMPLIGSMLNLFLAKNARRRVRALYDPLYEIVVHADSTRQLLLDRYESEFRQRILTAKKKHNDEVRQAHALYKATRAQSKRRVEEELTPAENRYQRLRDDSENRRSSELRHADELYDSRRIDIRYRHEKEMQDATARREGLLREIQARRDSDWSKLVENWRQTMERLQTGVADITETVRRLMPSWQAPEWQAWQPPAVVPPVLHLGQYHVQMDQVPRAIPNDADLRAMTPSEFDLPALRDFPPRSALLLQAADAGRAVAVQTLQAMVFRLLASLPAGKARFIIVDPVGLGQNFAAFMHLADYDEQLVASRIWTETPHIEQRLADLTLHMENVIQKYLRNQYETIMDYNEQAGEVAEAFRILVIANFPVNFSPEAIRRLLSIMQSGPRCGVLTLVSVDSKVPLPKGFDLADLEANSLNLLWEGQRFRWKDADFGPYPLTLEAPPDNDFANRILAQIGQAAVNAQRVEVPFEFISPPPEEWWKADSRKGLRIALGRAGATQRQHLDLGKGTAQHALIAGKTGSGKSSLLHALITNLALLYSPDEVELYLIDFKKGVEFKTYAVHDLPHARVIAIESEREFGLSVLQRLDAELRMRGERFRDVRAQDVNGFRQAVPNERMPRLMLIVDEFQEFFTEDDRISQEASQLLDRLVRQGRAFGMHVLLGSQTLGGAYTLARSTIDQMAVRIALQCSEADAHLILSDDNSAARLLSRPGEAIYNDANGLVEGNNPFQVVWLGDDRREKYLARIHEMAVATSGSLVGQQAGRLLPRLREAPIVFEGNAPADVSRNHLLNQCLAERAGSVSDGAATVADASGSLTENPREQRAWLGEAMAINDLTAAPFRRHHGSNLLLIGQQEEMSLGMLATAVVSLAAQMGQSGSTRFYIVDGRQADAPTDGPLARLPEVLPQKIRLSGWRDVPAIMAELSAEMECRQKDTGAAPSLYLVLFGIQRLRDLRKAEDDFSFSRKEESANPAQQFATLLREAPPLGIHTLMWCDTLNNLQRTFDRSSMRELTMRVVFQMNVSDSSNLIDSPLASKLGLHRALFFNEEDGRLDKFRPYGLPSETWLRRVQEQMRRRAETKESIMLP